MLRIPKPRRARDCSRLTAPAGARVVGLAERPAGVGGTGARALTAHRSGRVADLDGPGVAERRRRHAFEEQVAERAEGSLIGATIEPGWTVERGYAALPAVVGVGGGVARAVATHAERGRPEARHDDRRARI